MTEEAFTNHRAAGLALLSRYPDLPRKEAGFLGNVCVDLELTNPQRAWLVKLLKKYGLPPLAEGGAP
jgi:hypothetical protein